MTGDVACRQSIRLSRRGQRWGPCSRSADLAAARATSHRPTSTMTPEATKTTTTEVRASIIVVAARAIPCAVPRTPPPKRIGHDARWARSHSRDPGAIPSSLTPRGGRHVPARGQARGEEIDAADGEEDGEENEEDDESGEHDNPRGKNRCAAVSRPGGGPPIHSTDEPAGGEAGAGRARSPP